MFQKTTALLSSLVTFFLFLSPLTSKANTVWSAPLLQNHPLVGKIYNVKQEKFISQEILITALKKSPYVLIGEKHDNADHHRLELQLLESLVNKPHTQVVFEMLTDEQQSNISLLKADDNLVQMHEKLAWNDKGWLWSDYAALIQTSISHGAQIRAGNISRPIIKQIYQQNNIDALSNKVRFQTIKNISETAKEQILNQVFESHCQLMPKTKLVPMMTIQLARDASMANAISTSKKPSILIAGSFHTQKNVGVPLHLEKNGDQTSTTLLLAEVKQSGLKPGSYASPDEVDFIWFTPKQVEKDYCEGLRLNHKP